MKTYELSITAQGRALPYAMKFKAKDDKEALRYVERALEREDDTIAIEKAAERSTRQR